MRGNRLIGRYTVTGSLTVVSALSVSEGKDGIAADITCQRDGLGRLVIPGTALAGCLRRTVEDPRWGGDPGDKKNAAVSRITTHDATFTGSGEPLQIRDGVAIDRVSGAAAKRMLYGREVVAPGATFALSFSIDVVTGASDAKQEALNLATRLVQFLKAGVAIGGSTSRGLGEVKLMTAAEVTWTPLASRDEFLTHLVNGPAAVAKLPKITPAPRRVVSIRIPWQPQSPILVSVPTIGGVDAVPRHIKDAKGVRLVLPGSSIKGVLRSHAEHITRTLTGAETPDSPLKQFQQTPPLIRRLFGRAPDPNGKGGWRGAVTCADVLSQQPVAHWDRLISDLLAQKRDEQPHAATAIEKSAWLRVDDHVAISRWTGGSDDGKLFAWVAPWPGPRDEHAWQPMLLSVDLDRLGPDADAYLMLLAYVIRDLCDGWLAFGHGATRGYGEVSADPSQVTFEWEETEERRTLAELFADDSRLVAAWQDKTAAWVTAITEGTHS